MNITEWVRCPVYGNKTRLQLRADTELRNFPLYCPKCRQESLIDAKDLRVTVWKEKKVLCVATMGLFSGDGAGCSARLLKRYGAKVVGGLHIHMPDSVCDVKLLKKTMEKNQEIIKAADKKLKSGRIKLRIANIQRTDYIFMIGLRDLSASDFGVMEKQKIIQIN